MNKNKMIKEIISPVMEEKGFHFKRHVTGLWEWEKQIEDIREEVSIVDFRGAISLIIGKSMKGVCYVEGESLLSTLDNPRTKQSDWKYWETIDAELYKNILLDFKDILILNCDEVLKQHVKEIRSAIPNKKHFERYVEHFDELAEEGRNKLEISNQNVLEIWRIIMDNVRLLIGHPVEEVEDLLLGYAAFMEKEMLRQYGGRREINYDKENCRLCEVGKTRSAFNFLAEMFWAWESEALWETGINNFYYWYEREQKKK
ncbi:MAG: hypothetical protein IJ282_02525 [Lachnospiraceae bacterium]|nr:hypothetical protein [Lachnospiraceae bacterium]